MTAGEFGKIRKMLDFVINNRFSDFYGRKYSREKINLSNIKSPSDFEEIPFLTKKEIVDTDPYKRLFIKESKVGIWKMTSGTTSNTPLYTPSIYREQEYLDNLSRVLSQNNITKILLLMPSGFTIFRLYEWENHPKLSSYPVILCDLNNLDLAAEMLSELEIEALQTSPSALHYLMPFIKDTYDFNKIRYIRLAGEFTSKARFDFFRSYFKKAYFDFDLGASEAGHTALRCNFLNYNYPPGFYHPIMKDLYFEIVDEKGQVLPDGQRGEIILTSLNQIAFPLVRYKSGDSGTIKRFHCTCGRKYLLEIFGRIGHDLIRIAGVTLHRNSIEESLGKALGSRLQVDYEAHLFEEVYKNRLLPKLVIKINPRIQLQPQRLASRISKNLKVGPGLRFSDLVKMEIFSPLKVEYTGKFKKGFKTIKIISHLK
jgi:phenylacetate-CoA ligase